MINVEPELHIVDGGLQFSRIILRLNQRPLSEKLILHRESEVYKD